MGSRADRPDVLLVAQCVCRSCGDAWLMVVPMSGITGGFCDACDACGGYAKVETWHDIGDWPDEHARYAFLYECRRLGLTHYAGRGH